MQNGRADAIDGTDAQAPAAAAAPKTSDPKTANAAFCSTDEMAALRHRFRNQIQTITSLASLLGQRLPAGDGRDAFLDMRGRMEAIAVLNAEEALVAPPERTLAVLAERLRQLYDPSGRRRVIVRVEPIVAGEKRLTTFAQLLSEMLIDLFRNSAPDAHCSVEIAQIPNGGTRVRATASSVVDVEVTPISSLGLAILESLARAAGGGLARSVNGAFHAEVIAAPEGGAR